jgi:hypothetical protein
MDQPLKLQGRIEVQEVPLNLILLEGGALEIRIFPLGSDRK